MASGATSVVFKVHCGLRVPAGTMKLYTCQYGAQIITEYINSSSSAPWHFISGVQSVAVTAPLRWELQQRQSGAYIDDTLVHHRAVSTGCTHKDDVARACKGVAKTITRLVCRSTEVLLVNPGSKQTAGTTTQREPRETNHILKALVSPQREDAVIRTACSRCTTLPVLLQRGVAKAGAVVHARDCTSTTAKAFQESSTTRGKQMHVHGRSTREGGRTCNGC